MPGGGGGTPGNSSWGVPSGSPNSDPISDPKKCHFLHPFSDQTFKIHDRVILGKEISKSVKCFQISY